MFREIARVTPFTKHWCTYCNKHCLHQFWWNTTRLWSISLSPLLSVSLSVCVIDRQKVTCKKVSVCSAPCTGGQTLIQRCLLRRVARINNENPSQTNALSCSILLSRTDNVGVYFYYGLSKFSPFLSPFNTRFLYSSVTLTIVITYAKAQLWSEWSVTMVTEDTHAIFWH